MSARQPGQRRTKFQREIDLDRLAKWFAIPGNDSMRAAARALDLQFNTVKRDWEELLRRFSAEDAVAVQVGRRMSINRYRYIQQQAHDGWIKSQATKERRTAKKREQGREKGRESLEATTTTEGRVGDDKFLRTMAHCEDRICVLENLYPPKQTEMTGPSGGPIDVKLIEVVLSRTPDDERPEEIQPDAIDVVRTTEGQSVEGTV
jgi:hypothetical protein